MGPNKAMETVTATKTLTLTFTTPTLKVEDLLTGK
jgi:hypothetical protein